MAQTNESNTILGTRLTQARKEKNVLQKFVADKIGISAQVMANYEKGNREPNISTLNELAQYYGVTVDYLTGNSDYECFEVESLSHNIPLSEAIIKRILYLHENLEGYLEEVIVDDNFHNLLLTLKTYKYGIGDALKYLVESDEELKQLEKILSINKIDLAKVYYRKAIEDTIAEILAEYDNSDKKEV
jgi:transcriptional regulator with XRE-family HTH domain